MKPVATASHPGSGLAFALGAYFLWGLFPLYWKPLSHIPPMEILAHRMVWAALFLIALLTVQKNWSWLPKALASPRTVALFALSSVMLSGNWLTYIWAVASGHVLESSLGYFITPLINIILGRLVLGERLRPVQGLAVGLAFAGVAWLTFTVGSLPWIALVLALSFGVYGLLRKTAHLGSIEGLSLESLLMLLPAAGYLVWLELAGRAHLGHDSTMVNTMLLASGAVTAIPLLLFGAGARRLTLATLGVVQYISPTLQFLLGVFLYHEPFDAHRLIGFVLIWLALAVYSAEGLARSWLRRTQG